MNVYQVIRREIYQSKSRHLIVAQSEEEAQSMAIDSCLWATDGDIKREYESVKVGTTTEEYASHVEQALKEARDEIIALEAVKVEIINELMRAREDLDSMEETCDFWKDTAYDCGYKED